MSKPTNNEILNFLGNSGKTTKEIAENFEIKIIDVIIIMKVLPNVYKKLAYRPCLPGKWCIKK